MMYRVRVIAGKGRGKRLGFPTINMEIPDKLGVAHGIYAGWVQIDGKQYSAAIHYGPVPTFGQLTETLEAYLLDGVVEAGKEVMIELVAYIRDIKLFTDANELARAIQGDSNDARKILETYKS